LKRAGTRERGAGSFHGITNRDGGRPKAIPKWRCTIPSKRWTTGNKSGKRVCFKVFIHYLDDHIEAKKLFADAAEANEYYEQLCATRTANPASVVGLTGQNIRKYFRIDETCHVGRAVLDLDWM
jgi:hypothetical protein